MKINRLCAGDVFGRLTVIKDEHSTHALCLCSCGREKMVKRTSLRYGSSKSCGCAAAERLITTWSRGHGMSRTPEYQAWRSMVARCSNRDHPNFADYGGRGIAVCERWMAFENFLEDMGKRPPGFDLDREDNMGGYAPGNCRWVPHKTNQQNTRKSMRWTVNGVEFLSLSDAANATGVSDGVIRCWCLGYKVAGVAYPPRPGCSARRFYAKSDAT